MKSLARLFVLNFFLVFTQAWGQIPNADMELWDSSVLQHPTGWRQYGFANKVAGYKSSYAAKVFRTSAQNSGPGALIYGNPENNFTGGIPVNARPDSVVGFFKTHIPTGDTGWLLVFFKRNGHTISQDIFYLLGTDSAQFRRRAFGINYNDTGIADSLIIGFASTNPDNPIDGGFVVADSLHFTGGTGQVQVPNSNFESWFQTVVQTPSGWNTSNNAGLQTTQPVTRSNDHVFGNHSARIQNVWYDGQLSYGFIMAGRQSNQGPPAPGFALTGRDSAFYVNYKFFPQGDTMQIAIIIYDSGQMITTGSLSQSDSVKNWTQVKIPIHYPQNYTGTPDSAALFCAAFKGGSNPHGMSVLYVDGFRLNVPMNHVQKWSMPLRLYPNPANTNLNLTMHHALPTDMKLRVTDLTGKEIAAGYAITGRNTLKIETAQLPAGTYLFKISGTGLQNTGRFQVIH
ncbi:MAG: T9SS type A sorting domain-containing protein [Bacteroidetes bacterium]|nr:T9SS type A sorting domain-containing protein [Bacteroidota bacterium]